MNLGLNKITDKLKQSDFIKKFIMELGETLENINNQNKKINSQVDDIQLTEKEEMEFYREENQFLQDYFNKQENDLSDGEVFIVTDKYENDDEYHRYKVAQYKNNLECKYIAFEKEFLQNVKLGDVVKKIDGKYIYDEKATQYINDSINEIKQNIIRKRDF